ncbi:MAG: hypothetical protein P8Z68_08710, partial [Kineosporiaceae bacterium]
MTPLSNVRAGDSPRLAALGESSGKLSSPRGGNRTATVALVTCPATTVVALRDVTSSCADEGTLWGCFLPAVVAAGVAPGYIGDPASGPEWFFPALTGPRVRDVRSGCGWLTD